MSGRLTLSQPTSHTSETEERQPLLGASKAREYRPPAPHDVSPKPDSRRDGDDWNRVISNETSDSAFESSEELQKAQISWRYSAAVFCFFIVGILVASIGVLIPYLEANYQLNDTTISLIFLPNLLGYLLASLSNSSIHTHLGRRGIAVIAPCSHLILTLLASTHPPYPVLLLAFTFGSFGTGLVDGSWCAWVSGLPKANTLFGVLHGSFSLGASFGPWLVTHMLVEIKLPWYAFFYVMTGACLVELIVLVWAFRSDNALQYSSEKTSGSQNGFSALKAAFANKVTWICAVYSLAYVGTEAAVSDWIVTFMLRFRLASPYVSGICGSAFWIGMASGRLLLGFVTDSCGVRVSVVAYLALGIVTEVVFSLIGNIAVSVGTVAFLGFFLGPVYPAGLVMAARLLPQELHVSAISLATFVGQSGGTIFPFALGVIAQTWGIQALRPVVFGLLLATLLIWVFFAGLKKQQRQELSGDLSSQAFEESR